MQIVSIGDNLHDMSNPVFLGKIRKIFQNVVYWKFLPSVLTVKHYSVWVLSESTWKGFGSKSSKLTRHSASVSALFAELYIILIQYNVTNIFFFPTEYLRICYLSTFNEKLALIITDSEPTNVAQKRKL